MLADVTCRYRELSLYRYLAAALVNSRPANANLLQLAKLETSLKLPHLFHPQDSCFSLKPLLAVVIMGQCPFWRVTKFSWSCCLLASEAAGGSGSGAAVHPRVESGCLNVLPRFIPCSQFDSYSEQTWFSLRNRSSGCHVSRHVAISIVQEAPEPQIGALSRLQRFRAQRHSQAIKRLFNQLGQNPSCYRAGFHIRANMASCCCA